MSAIPAVKTRPAGCLDLEAILAAENKCRPPRGCVDLQALLEFDESERKQEKLKWEKKKDNYYSTSHPEDEAYSAYWEMVAKYHDERIQHYNSITEAKWDAGDVLSKSYIEAKAKLDVHSESFRHFQKKYEKWMREKISNPLP